MEFSPINFVHLCEIFLINTTIREIGIDILFNEEV